jgi:hypothetical protein
MDAENELIQIDEAIDAILKGGQSYTINTGGGSRQVSYADYNALVRRRNELQTQMAAAGGMLGTRITAGW